MTGMSSKGPRNGDVVVRAAWWDDERDSTGQDYYSAITCFVNSTNNYLALTPPLTTSL